MPVAQSRITSLTLTLLAGIVLTACSSKPELKKGEKAIDVAAVVRQKMPASVKDREAWAQAIAKTFASQKLAPTEENVCSVLAVAQQESNYQADPAVPGLNKIAWQEIDRRAEKMHIPVFLVHTALKIKSPNGKSYSERLDSVKTEKQLSAIFDDFIGMVPMGAEAVRLAEPGAYRRPDAGQHRLRRAAYRRLPVENRRYRTPGGVQPARRSVVRHISSVELSGELQRTAVPFCRFQRRMVRQPQRRLPERRRKSDGREAGAGWRFDSLR